MLQIREESLYSNRPSQNKTSTTHGKHANSFLDKMSKLADNRGNCDVVIRNGEQEILAHKFILDINSTMMLTGDVDYVPNERCFSVRLYSEFNEYPDVISDIIRSFYSGHISIDEDNVKLIHKFAVAYSVRWLVKVAIDEIQAMIVDGNFMEYLKYATIVSCDELFSVCLKKLTDENVDKLIPLQEYGTLEYQCLKRICLYSNLSPCKQLELIRTWYDRDPTNRLSNVKNLFSELDFHPRDYFQIYSDSLDKFISEQESLVEPTKLNLKNVCDQFHDNPSSASEVFNCESNTNSESSMKNDKSCEQKDLKISSVDCSITGHDNCSDTTIPILYCVGVNITQPGSSNCNEPGSDVRNNPSGESSGNDTSITKIKDSSSTCDTESRGSKSNRMFEIANNCDNSLAEFSLSRKRKKSLSTDPGMSNDSSSLAEYPSADLHVDAESIKMPARDVITAANETADKETADVQAADAITADTVTADTGTADVEVADTGPADTGTADTGRIGPIRAGIGVFWAPDDPRNVCEPLWGKPSTDRAALWAAIRALQVALAAGLRRVEVRSDSKYLVKGVRRWRKRWGRKNGSLFRCLDNLMSMILVTWVYVEGSSDGCHSYQAGSGSNGCYGYQARSSSDGCHGYRAAVNLARIGARKTMIAGRVEDKSCVLGP